MVETRDLIGRGGRNSSRLFGWRGLNLSYLPRALKRNWPQRSLYIDIRHLQSFRQHHPLWYRNNERPSLMLNNWNCLSILGRPSSS
ncbi:hypothetical protein LshimejAT787_0902140 [Lyophyllum shimeji]|uniref:Uncharacterized protein n=1 Tax=Lyophyllum shimeji TaxID=47721 RepID=A0A9P3PSY7_LYOSH|nr:hypothetical protein LshimejAT787_0902140 [Lyophyllum shimeji]